MLKERSRIRRSSFFAVAVGLLAMAGAGHDDFVEIVLPGVSDMQAYGIDNHGTVSGLYGDAAGNFHSFIYADGVVTTVDGPTSNPPLSQADFFNLNNKGVVGGNYNDDAGNSRAATYNIHTQEWDTLPLISGPVVYNVAGGVNSQGISAGNWTDDITFATGFQGWTFDPKTGQYSFFDVPGVDKTHFIGTVVNDINNAGVIVGYYSDPTGTIHGFTKRGNCYQTIDVPGAQDTQVGGINSQGDLGGNYFDGTTQHGFVMRHNGDLITFDVPNAINTFVEGISENGNITGLYQTADKHYHAFYKLKAVH
jgi:hypothetical protein